MKILQLLVDWEEKLEIVSSWLLWKEISLWLLWKEELKALVQS
jgi:hypothetical protein